jgi:hypothetical protein
MTEGDSHTINHESCLLRFNVKNSVTQLRVGKPRGLIPVRQNESRKVETTVVKWVITKGRNTGYQKFCTWRRMFNIDRLPM